MKLHLHKYIFKLILRLFMISPSFVYAEGFRISLLPTQTEQVISCISFFAHKISVRDLTEFEYRKLVALANYELNMKTLPPLPNGNGESQMDVAKKLEEGMLEIVQLGISHRVYQEVLNYVKTLEEINEFPNPIQINREDIFQKQKSKSLELINEAKEVLRTYRAFGFDPDNLEYRNTKNETYLHLAVKNNHQTLVEALLFLIPDLIDEQDDFGFTAHFYASLRKYDNIAQVLLKNGANPNIKPNRSETSLIFAVKNNRLKVVDTLLEYKADPHIQDRNGDSAFHYAVIFFGRTEILKSLMKVQNININILNARKQTALIVAAKRGDLESVEILLKDPNILLNLRCEENFSALIHSVRAENLEIIKLILDHKNFNLDMKEMLQAYKSTDNKEIKKLILNRWM